MSIRRLSMILGDIELKRVNNGEVWASQLNRACPSISRDCNGELLTEIYDTADQATKDSLESVLTMTQEDLTGLLDEIYRIKETATISGVTVKEAYLLAVITTFCIVVITINSLLIALYVGVASSIEPLPRSYVASLALDTFNYYAPP